MPRPRPTHTWTSFELHTLFCLIVRGIHINGYPTEEGYYDGVPLTPAERKRYGLPSRRGKGKGLNAVSMRDAHMAVTGMLNHACRGGVDGKGDIGLMEVSDMITHLLKTKRAALKLMERSNKGNVTRLLRQVWQRGIKFDGSNEEWKMRKERERKDREEAEERRERGDEVYDRLLREEKQKNGGLWVGGPSIELVEESFAFGARGEAEESVMSVED